ncbi:hypothetical protein DFH07DRAFT_246307 [Mycena maculata]|uniref:MYND-type domain-containing protein n=1 Tax=Mycena maculata TaxID=230809 RepID=A0AAD7HQP9_9AGAR|nr:hypothetical protein DFH07DRAFT_246307 [Mycena maculata]
MTNAQALCFCGKPAGNRCAACKTVAYCSQECQRRDWKAHKIQCKSATTQRHANVPQVGSPSQIEELERIVLRTGFLAACVAAGLDPTLVHGAGGIDLYDGPTSFWRLDAPIQKRWEAEARTYNEASKRFWMGYFSPITDSRVWIDVVLDVVLNARLPGENGMWRANVHMTLGRPHCQNISFIVICQAHAKLLAGLFPHLSSFSHAQNSTLLDIFCSLSWATNDSDVFRRAKLDAEILFAHGEPTSDLIAQLVARCLAPARTRVELTSLLQWVALPIQTYHPDRAGTHILDLALVIASPWSPGPMDLEGRRIPGEKILQIADTSPAAFKHLLHAVVRLCRERLVTAPAQNLLRIFETFGVQIGDPETDGETDALAWLFVELPEEDTESSKRLSRLLEDADEGRLTHFGLMAKDEYVEELRQPTLAATRRLKALQPASRPAE